MKLALVLRDLDERPLRRSSEINDRTAVDSDLFSARATTPAAGHNGLAHIEENQDGLGHELRGHLHGWHLDACGLTFDFAELVSPLAELQQILLRLWA